MKRLTGRKEERTYIVGCPDFALPKIAGLIIQQTVDRLAAIEDILGDSYDLDKLRELADAVRAKRCFALPVLPDLRPGMTSSECFILLDSGEIVSDNVCSINIGPNSDGEVVMLFETFEYGDFDDDDVGKHIFWKFEDAQKAAAALKRNGDDR